MATVDGTLIGRIEDGRDYLFLDDDEYDRRLESGTIEAPATIHGAKYGIPAEAIDAIRGESIGVLVLDGQGALDVARNYGGCAIAVVGRDEQERIAALSARFDGNELSDEVQADRMHSQVFDAVLERCYNVHNAPGEQGFQSAVRKLDFLARAHWEIVAEPNEALRSRALAELADDMAPMTRYMAKEMPHGIVR